MTIALGLDTGGTYTDAVIVDIAEGKVLHSAKALTTPADLSQGLSQALDLVFRDPRAPRPRAIELVGLSTTLATNAIVERAGGPVGLILIGYNPGLISSFGLNRELAAQEVAFIAGGHDYSGFEKSPLDREGLIKTVTAWKDRVEALAVSGYFSVRNPVHEIEARGIIEELTDQPVTCGHQLTGRLDSIRRAATAALNASLIPLLRRLIATARRLLAARGIKGRLMVVKGDGSLVAAEWALERPIETILSGPAASVIGAWTLARAAGVPPETGGFWVLDMGGTTSDLAFMTNGRPGLNRDGARVGGWRTMIQAMDIHTVGLGGDSHARLEDSRLSLGPRRVVPLCFLAGQYPEVLDELEEQKERPSFTRHPAEFLVGLGTAGLGLTPREREIQTRLGPGPVSLARLEKEAFGRDTFLPPLDRLLGRKTILKSGFTPTDALHALGKLELWEARASRAAAEILARAAGKSWENFCLHVVAEVSRRVAREIVQEALLREGGQPGWLNEPGAAYLIDKALAPGGQANVALQIRLNHPLTAIGAPAPAYLPQAAERLGTRLIIPPHHEVANAVGAVAGAVIVRQEVLISPGTGASGRPGLHLHLPWEALTFSDLEAAVAHARREVGAWITEQARQAGADQVIVEVIRHDRGSPDNRGPRTDDVYLGTTLTFTASGRPALSGRD
ncbi:MAG: hydantoinase/oxoprolinase family protein [Thermodesulfobacteriota bacterium]